MKLTYTVVLKLLYTCIFNKYFQGWKQLSTALRLKLNIFHKKWYV